MTKLIKIALLITAAMNIFGAVLFLPPIRFFREFYELPDNAHPFL